MVARTLMLLMTAVSLGCRSEPSVSPPPQTGTPPSTPASSIPLEMRLGWVAGSCLATANKTLTAGSTVTVVSMDAKSTIVDGRVIGGATPDATCPALNQDRRKQNESKWSIYALKLAATVDLGIGVIGDTNVMQGGIDLTGDGTPEIFTHCATSEGVSFRVWRGTPYQGLPLWSGYYYLGYDVEANCPP